MENYKTEVFDPETLQFINEVETQIPEEIVVKAKELLGKFESKNWLISPMTIKSDGSEVYFGMLERGTDGEGIKYKITITKIEEL